MLSALRAIAIVSIAGNRGNLALFSLESTPTPVGVARGGPAVRFLFSASPMTRRRNIGGCPTPTGVSLITAADGQTGGTAAMTTQPFILYDESRIGQTLQPPYNYRRCRIIQPAGIDAGQRLDSQCRRSGAAQHDLPVAGDRHGRRSGLWM